MDEFGRPPTRGMSMPGPMGVAAAGGPQPTGQLHGPGMYQAGVSMAQPHFAGQPPGTGMRQPPGTGMRLGTGMQPPGTGMRLGTGMRPPSGQAPPGTGVGLMTPLNIDARPVTQQGVAAARVKTGQATAGPGRQVADKTYYLNILRNKTQDISKEMDRLQEEIDTKQREGVDFVHLQRRLEGAQKEVQERQATLADYNFATKLAGREMDDLEGESKRRSEELNYEKKKIDKVFEDRQAKEQETREAENAIEELRRKAHERLQGLDKDKVQRFDQLNFENQKHLRDAEQCRRQCFDLSRRVTQMEEELSADTMRQKGVKLTQEREFLEMQINDLKMDEDDPGLSFAEAKDRLLSKIKEDNDAIVRMTEDTHRISHEIKEKKERIAQIEENLKASKDGKSDKYRELQKKDADMSTFLEAYPDKHQKDLEDVQNAKSNIRVLLKHIADETKRQGALPSQGDVKKEGEDLAFKQQQLANAETTTDRLELQLNERRLDLERVEELDRKMSQEMDNLNQKMNEMRMEIKTYSDLGAVEQSAIAEKQHLTQRRSVLQNNQNEFRALVEQRRKICDAKRGAANSETSKALEAQETKMKALEDNLFLMRETVAQKSAETNIAPIRDECRNICSSIHTMLAAS
eukprot:TRINITY_DN3560_c0_g1_i1.p1 TRINITY_DN3560_c0_g1~~TRINITY_DN3560_c0_g1_i1.p1  ORF type:complete len:633 (-),score=181.91 TRINITY_DN3560_c0_g1_i1:259-2157(-)